MAGIGELRSVAGDDEVHQTDIKANCLTFSRYGGRRLTVVCQDRGMVLAAGIPADRDRLHLADDVPMDHTFDPTDFRQVDARPVDLHPLRILDRLAPMLGLEARVFGSLGEEVVVCSREILQRCLQRLGIGIAKPLELLFQFWQADRHRVVVQPVASRAIQFTRQDKRVVPHPPCTAELDSERVRLVGSRIEADAGGVEHVLNIARPRLIRKEVPLRSTTPYIPGLKAGVLRGGRIIIFMLFV